MAEARTLALGGWTQLPASGQSWQCLGKGLSLTSASICVVQSAKGRDYATPQASQS